MAGSMNIAIVSAGLVGSGWALGFDVRAYAPSEQVRARILPWASESLRDMATRSTRRILSPWSRSCPPHGPIRGPSRP